MAEVSIQKGTYSDPGIERLLEPLGGMERFVDKGDRVLLKVNLLSAKDPQKAVTTHPEFIRAVATAVRKSGGHPYIGDSPGGTFSKRTLIISVESKTTSSRAPSRVSSSFRALLRRFSVAWASFSMKWISKNPATPLMV